MYHKYTKNLLHKGLVITLLLCKFVFQYLTNQIKQKLWQKK